MSEETFPQPSGNFISVIRPVPTKLDSNSNILKSLASPRVQGSPLALPNDFALRLRSSCFENSAVTNKNNSAFPTKVEVHQGNPMHIQFDGLDDFKKDSLIKFSDFSNITKNFFEPKSSIAPQSKEFQIKSVLFEEGNNKEICKDTERVMKKNEKNSNDEEENSDNGNIEKNSIDNMKKNSTVNTTMVTNIVNNFYLNFNEKNKKCKGKREKSQSVFIQRKRGRKPSTGMKSYRPKKLKKKDKTLITINLNQICINNVSLSKFPLVSLPEDALSVEFFQRMLIEENYFQVVNKYYSNVSVIDEEKCSKPSFIRNFIKEKEKLSSSLFLVEENENETNPIQIVKNFYAQIKKTVLTIQKNFIGKKKNSLNVEQCMKLQKLIESCNELTDIMTDFKKSGTKRQKILTSNCNMKTPDFNQMVKVRNNKQKHFKTYLCEFCNKAYPNGQGLGGHISRIHPNQSYKYKDKIRIRNERSDKRQLLFEIKKKFFSEHGMDLEKMIQENKKDQIQKFLFENKEEYQKIKKEEQKKILNAQVIKTTEHELPVEK